jgi:hypothetical protein
MIPVNHLLSEEDEGFQVNKSNSNRERWAIIVAVTR